TRILCCSAVSKTYELSVSCTGAMPMFGGCCASTDAGATKRADANAKATTIRFTGETPLFFGAESFLPACPVRQARPLSLATPQASATDRCDKLTGTPVANRYTSIMSLQEVLGSELPIIQAPMAGSQGSALAIAVSEAGGVGSL